ncbi:MAG: DUF5009 domain-containing protein [Sumerlaeia bacterium]
MSLAAPAAPVPASSGDVPEVLHGTEETPESPKPTPPPRALALDAVRGLAILAMCWSGRVPIGDLPGWMSHHYHVPNPEGGGFTQQLLMSGYTWVDWVFPAFLFSMGAAFPFALGGRLKKGWPLWKISTGVVMRGVALLGFAIYIWHMSFSRIAAPSQMVACLLSLLGFGMLFLVYQRFPDKWPAALRHGLKFGGVALAIGYLLLLDYKNGAEVFALEKDAGEFFERLTFIWRRDIIIHLLAIVSIFGAFIWLLTKASVKLRLAFLVLPFIAFLCQGDLDKIADPSISQGIRSLPGMGAVLGFFGGLFPFPDRLGYFQFLKFLWPVIPGTIIGDLMVRWMKDRKGEDPAADKAPTGKLLGAAALVVVLCAVVFTGLQARWPVVTLLIGGALMGAIHVLMPPASGPATNRFLRQLSLWGIVWLGIGLFMDAVPYLNDGGIKKGPPITLSYPLVSTGLSIYMLLAFTVWLDLARKRKTFWLLWASGQNPLLAYAAIGMLLLPLVSLPIFPGSNGAVSLNSLVVGAVENPWLEAGWGLLQTIALAAFAGFCTAKKILWRT